MSTLPALKLDAAASLRIAAASYLAALDRRPVLTKSCTSGTLYLISELVSTAVAARGLTAQERAAQNAERGAGPGKAGALNVKALLRRYGQALKLAGYGFFVAAPLDHFLYSLLARIFAGRTSRKARILEVVSANAVILPIQNAVYLAVLSIIGGARSVSQVVQDVRAGFLDVMKFTVVVSTLSLTFAQRFLPPIVWTPFFSLVGASMDTVINVQEKQRALAVQRKKALKDEVEKETGGYETEK
ncbi:hypothetical protein JCM10207_008072 [Rhodosporidiobolus poonsookiae]